MTLKAGTVVGFFIVILALIVAIAGSIGTVLDNRLGQVCVAGGGEWIYNDDNYKYDCVSN